MRERKQNVFDDFVAAAEYLTPAMAGSDPEARASLIEILCGSLELVQDVLASSRQHARSPC